MKENLSRSSSSRIHHHHNNDHHHTTTTTTSGSLSPALRLARVTSTTSDFLKEMDSFISHSRDTDVSTASALLNTSLLSHGRSSRSKSRERSERSRSRSRSRRESTSSPERSERSRSRHKSRSRSSTGRREERDETETATTVPIRSKSPGAHRKSSPARTKVQFNDKAGEMFQYSPTIFNSSSSNSHPYKHAASPRTSPLAVNSRDSLLLPRYDTYRTQQPRAEETEPAREMPLEQENIYPLYPTQKPPATPPRHSVNHRRNDTTMHIDELLSPLEPLRKYTRSTAHKRASTSPMMSSPPEKQSPHTVYHSEPSFTLSSPTFHINSPLRLSPQNSGFQEQCDMMKQRIRRLIEINNNISHTFHYSDHHHNDSMHSHNMMSPTIRGVSKIDQLDTSDVFHRHMHDIR